jgi:PadR family transcriptional regulator AphA
MSRSTLGYGLLLFLASVLAAALLFGRSSWGGYFLVDRSFGQDIYHLSTLYERFGVHLSHGHYPHFFPEFQGGYPVSAAGMFGLYYPGTVLHTLLPADLGWTWRVSTSQLYALLKRLESGGLVTSAMESQETRPSKRVFSLNTSGKKKFMEWLKQPSSYVRDLRTEFLAKLFFFRKLSVKGSPALVYDQIKVLESVRERFVKLRKEELDHYKRMVFGFKTATLNGWLDWLEKEAVSFAKEIETNL